MNRIKPVYLFLSIIFALTTLSNSAFGTETVKIGVAGAHSGNLASYGLPTVNAVKMVVDKLNAKGGINGKQIELFIEDDVCKPEVATNTATKLISQGVNMIIGHICSGATKAALPIYRDAKAIVISPSATNPDLTQSGDYPNFFRTIASDDAQARTEVDFAIDVLQVKKIAVIHDKGDYGKGLAEFAQKFIKESDKAEIVLFEGITPDAVDYSAVIQKIKRFKADAVIFGGYHPEASKLVTQMRKKRMKTLFISDDGVKDDTFIKVAGKYAEGVYATGPADVSGNPITQAAREEHKKVYNESPGAFFENAYAAALALTNAIEQANSTDYDAVGNTLRTHDVATTFGTIHFDAKGDATGIGFSMYQVQDGKYVQVQ